MTKPQPISTAESIVPLLVRIAVPRTEGDDIPGSYSTEQDMWVVETSDGLRPIIEADSSLAELTTKTKVNSESDDHVPGPLAEVTTKTDAQAERDDQTSLAGATMDLTTKTHAQLERDDTAPEEPGMW